TPIEAVPDIMGDYKDSTKKGSGPRSFQMPAHDSPLPARVRVPLGRPVELGDLEVLAERVEQKPITFLYRGRGRNPEPATDGDSLVLHLRLKNISRDVFFHPTDPYFDRRWIEGKDVWPPPYTILEA